MRFVRGIVLLSSLLLPGLCGFLPSSAGAQAPAGVELLVRGDDMGTSHAANEACIASYRSGIVRSVEVLVPGAWFLESAKLLKENPGLDAGVHLCLTSEWEGCKWRPLTCAPTLVDENGYFRPMTSQRRDFPPNTGFLEAKPDPAEVERELRAQIELARRHLPRLSHLSAHMGTATATPQLRAITRKLAQEYQLRLEDDSLKHAGSFPGATPAEREAALLRLLETLTPGRWLLIEHPGADTPEMRAQGHPGYYNVASERAAVTVAFTSERVKSLVRERGVKLISYGELDAVTSR
jgi:hypothetical protein